MEYLAKYNGHCLLCDSPIVPGQAITWHRASNTPRVHAACYQKIVDSCRLMVIDEHKGLLTSEYAAIVRYLRRTGQVDALYNLLNDYSIGNELCFPTLYVRNPRYPSYGIGMEVA